MEVKQIIDDALFEYYSERGLEVPQWQMQRNPEWWISYLNDLGIDPQNPQCYNTCIETPYYGLPTLFTRVAQETLPERSVG